VEVVEFSCRFRSRIASACVLKRYENEPNIYKLIFSDIIKMKSFPNNRKGGA